MADGKITRAELAEQVRLLREEVAALRAERAAHTCNAWCGAHLHCNWGHCHCATMHTMPGCAPYSPPYTWTVTSGGWDSGTITTTNVVAAAAGAPMVQFLALGN